MQPSVWQRVNMLNVSAINNNKNNKKAANPAENGFKKNEKKNPHIVSC